MFPLLPQLSIFKSLRVPAKLALSKVERVVCDKRYELERRLEWLTACVRRNSQMRLAIDAARRERAVVDVMMTKREQECREMVAAARKAGEGLENARQKCERLRLVRAGRGRGAPGGGPGAAAPRGARGVR
jgi:hypothetical protein